ISAALRKHLHATTAQRRHSTNLKLAGLAGGIGIDAECRISAESDISGCVQGADRCPGDRTRRYDTAIDIDGSDDRALTSQQAVGIYRHRPGEPRTRVRGIANSQSTVDRG